MLSKKQSESLRKQLIEQVETTFPEDKKAFAKNQILSMNDEQLIQILKQNQQMQAKKQAKEKVIQQCIFCSIANGKVASYKIDDNKDNVAVLEINPISKAHTIIIPKKHIESAAKLPQNTFSLAKKIARKLKSKLKPKPKEVQLHSTNLFGHEIINVLPIYEEENINSERYQEDKKELKKLEKLLKKKVSKKKPAKKIIKKKPVQEKIGKKEIKASNMPFFRRIP